MIPKTKLDCVLSIVDWEHRYATGKLMGGSWVLERIRFYMSTLNLHGAQMRYRELFIDMG